MIVDYRNCDALEMIADLKSQGIKMDIVITDPPYMIDYKSDKVKSVNRRKIFADTELHTKTIRKILYATEEIMTEPSALFMFSSWQKLEFFKEMMTEVSTLHSCIVWHKMNGGMGDLKRSFAPSYEMLLYGTKGDIHLPFRQQDMVQFGRVTGSNKTFHPTQKPVDLLRWAITSIKPMGQRWNVFDPFAGSGSTLVAGILENCNVYGAEIDPEYHKKGTDFIAKENKQLRLFNDNQLEIPGVNDDVSTEH